MADLIVPLAIAAACLVGLGIFVHRRARARRAFEQVLTDQGFRAGLADPAAGIDLSVTVQWPEARGITYLSYFTKQEQHTTTGVSNVRCREVTGARMGRLGAAMKSDEIRQTVISCSFPNRRIPRFCLCPRHWQDQFRNLVEGWEEIATGDAGFDRAFFIVGASDTDAGCVLTQSVRAEMVSCPDVMLAAGNKSVLLFRQGVVLSPHELSQCLGLMETIRKEITRQSA